MQTKLRTCIAFIAGRLITGLEVTSIYDHGQAKSVRFEGPVGRAFIKIYDHDRECYTSGGSAEGTVELFDFGYQHHIDLRTDGNTFEGYEDYTPSLFRGEVNGSEISFYDDNESQTFLFSLTKP
jgi:hypothetical protein